MHRGRRAGRSKPAETRAAPKGFTPSAASQDDSSHPRAAGPEQSERSSDASTILEVRRGALNLGVAASRQSAADCARGKWRRSAETPLRKAGSWEAPTNPESRLGTMKPVAQTSQSAVSRVFNPQAPSRTDALGKRNALTQTNTRPTESRRYSRLNTCATEPPFMGR
jgi:hypothetical protein